MAAILPGDAASGLHPLAAEIREGALGPGRVDDPVRRSLSCRMSELDDAIARLKAAVARLEAASSASKRAAEDEQLAAIAGRIDAALAKLGLLLEREE